MLSPLPTPVPILDLTETVWTPEQFKSNELTVIESKTMHVAYQSLEVNTGQNSGKLPTWLNKITTAISDYVNVENGHHTHGIYKVTEAIDAIALTKLSEIEEKVAKANTIKDPLQRSEILQVAINALNNLGNNLKNHNVVIEEFNQSFFTNLLICSNHNRTLEILNTKIHEIQYQKVVLSVKYKNSSLSKFNEFVKDLRLNIQNGLVVDKRIVDSCYTPLKRLLNFLGDEVTSEQLKELNKLLNSAYLLNVLKKSNPHEQELPTSLKLFINLWGLNPQEISKKIFTESSVFLLKIQNILKSENLAEVDTPMIIGLAQNVLLYTLAEDISIKAQIEKESLFNVLKCFYNLELKLEDRSKLVENEVRMKIIEMIKNLPFNDFKKNFLIEKVMGSLFSSPIPKVLHEFFTHHHVTAAELKFDKPVALSIIKSFDELIDKINLAAIEKEFYSFYLDEGLKLVHSFSYGRGEAWLEKNREARCFEFQQGKWGIQQALGSGVCNAINYRWIRHLLLHPTKPIQSPLDLDDQRSNIEGPESSLISIKDRIDQATYRLESLLKPKSRSNNGQNTQGKAIKAPKVSGMGETILKRDGLTYKELVEGVSSVTELFAFMQNEKEVVQTKEGGIFDIGIFHSKKVNGELLLSNGHAIGMQIDPYHKIYRFWDINSGFYQYPSYQELCQAVQDYMNDFYNGIYNHFNAGQYAQKK